MWIQKKHFINIGQNLIHWDWRSCGSCFIQKPLFFCMVKYFFIFYKLFIKMKQLLIKHVFINLLEQILSTWRILLTSVLLFLFYGISLCNDLWSVLLWSAYINNQLYNEYLFNEFVNPSCTFHSNNFCICTRHPCILQSNGDITNMIHCKQMTTTNVFIALALRWD